jgi:hypothetical protein
MGSPPVIFWKRPIFLPAATSRKRARLLEAHRRDLVIAAGVGETELQHLPDIRDILTGY